MFESWKFVVKKIEIDDMLGKNLGLSSRVLTPSATFLQKFFYQINFSSYSLCWFSFFLNSYAAFIACQGHWKKSVLLYFAALVLNLSAKILARTSKQNTYYWNFFDGFITVFNAAIFRFGLLGFIFITEKTSPLFFLIAVYFLLAPYADFIYDRYAAFARWIREDLGRYIPPAVYKDGLIKFVLSVIDDWEVFALIISMIIFPLGVWLYGVGGIIFSLMILGVHINNAISKMCVDNYQSSLKKFKKEDNAK